MGELNGAKQLLAEAIGAEIAAVPEAARVGAFERWDSLAHMRLILALEEKIGRKLDPDEAVKIESLKDIAALLDRRS
ncbi:MAG TPA: acyl carrier protein [Xanthobacteraceae bacterium]|nr:acyl carrier protein [Xanthobacteraceae bacterium]